MVAPLAGFTTHWLHYTDVYWLRCCQHQCKLHSYNVPICIGNMRKLLLY